MYAASAPAITPPPEMTRAPPDPGGGAASASASATARGVVNYRSSALEATAPSLSAAVDITRIPAIMAANQMAERVREDFKKRGKSRRGASSKSIPANSEEAEKAGRYDRRLQMNRQSAAASRVRREAYIKALEQQLAFEDEKYKKLQAELNAERSAHLKLRSDVEKARVLAVGTPQAPGPVETSASLSTMDPEWLVDESIAPPIDFNQLLLSSSSASSTGQNGVAAAAGTSDELQADNTIAELFSGLEDLPYGQMSMSMPMGATDPEDPDEAIERLLNFD